jgi:hypothetical protein
MIIFIQQFNQKNFIITYSDAFGDLLFDRPKSRQKALANLNSLTGCGQYKIELLGRKFADRKLTITMDCISITNRKYC